MPRHLQRFYPSSSESYFDKAEGSSGVNSKESPLAPTLRSPQQSKDPIISQIYHSLELTNRLQQANRIRRCGTVQSS